MKSNLLYGLVFCIASAGFVGWREYAVRTHGTPHFEIVADPSWSHVQDCEAMVGLAEQAIHADVSSSSTLTILALGDQTTAGEPWRLGQYTIPTSRKVIEGRKVIEKRQQDLLHDIWSKCQSIHRTTISPIYLGVKQALADLRAKGCNESSHCQIFVDSDLEENVEPFFQKSIQGTNRRRPALSAPLENAGVGISFCGFVATINHPVNSSGKETIKPMRREPDRDDRLRQVWISLVSDPEIVSFEPFCPNP